MSIACKNRNSNYYIFSDSESLLKSLQYNKFSIKTNKYIFEVRKKYLEFTLNNTNNIKFFWVPAHYGLTGNEQADHLDKNATNNLKPEIQSAPFSDFFEQFKKLAVINTRKKIKEMSDVKGTHYFIFFLLRTKIPMVHQ